MDLNCWIEQLKKSDPIPKVLLGYGIQLFLEGTFSMILGIFPTSFIVIIVNITPYALPDSTFLSTGPVVIWVFFSAGIWRYYARFVLSEETPEPLA
jgi:hypothetical protein